VTASSGTLTVDEGTTVSPGTKVQA
jgi:hypothetical protein